jgi:hypothetical protein
MSKKKKNIKQRKKIYLFLKYFWNKKKGLLIKKNKKYKTQ